MLGQVKFDLKWGGQKFIKVKAPISGFNNRKWVSLKESPIIFPRIRSNINHFIELTNFRPLRLVIQVNKGKNSLLSNEWKINLKI